jgi:hypothetical protein
MPNGKAALFLCALTIAISVEGASPRAAAESECSAPLDAVIALPAPIRKWGQISCTPSGQVLTGREGWVWAWLEGATTVRIPSQMEPTNQTSVGNDSYFVSVEASAIEEEELGVPLSIFQAGLSFEAAEPRGYRAEITSVSGLSTTIYFFDFGRFAGGMWCPEGSCIPDSRFMIMESEHKTKQHPPSI